MPVMFSLLLIMNDGEKSFQMGELLQITEQFQEKEADGVMGMASNRGVSSCTDGSDEREIDQRGDKAGESTLYLP
jgi:hypothetical protein